VSNPAPTTGNSGREIETGIAFFLASGVVTTRAPRCLNSELDREGGRHREVKSDESVMDNEDGREG